MKKIWKGAYEEEKGFSLMQEKERCAILNKKLGYWQTSLNSEGDRDWAVAEISKSGSVTNTTGRKGWKTMR